MVLHKWVVSYGAVMALLLAAGQAQAGIVCCNDDKGRRICGDPSPAECLGRAYKEIGRGGTARSYDAPLKAEEKAAQARKEREEREAAVLRRQRTSLLTSYANEKEIITARNVELNKIQAQRESLLEMVTQGEKKSKALQAQLAATTDASLKEALAPQQSKVDSDLRKNKKLLESRDDEIAQINARYDDILKRYRELSASEGGK